MRIFTLDDLDDEIAVYGTSCTLMRKIKPNYSKVRKDVVVLAFAYSERQERIGAVLKDFTLIFWENGDGFEFEKSVNTVPYCQECQTNIWFFEYFNAWVTADRTGCLYVWNLQMEQPDRRIKLVGDTQVNDLVVIPCVGLVAVVQERKVNPESNKLYPRRKREEKEEDSWRKDGEHEGPVIYLYDFLSGEVATKIELGAQSRNPHTLQYSEQY
jgi:hypothetical protein